MNALRVGGFDIETTGLNEPDHRLVEACIIRYDWTPGSEPTLVDTWEQRIDPQRAIDKGAQAVHGITSADLVGKPLWTDVAPVMRDILDGCDLVVGHNLIDFDVTFCVREWERIGVSLPDFDLFDTMLDGRWATPWGKSPSLSELCFACGVAYDPALAHAAQYDVARTMDCFFWGMARGSFEMKAGK